MSKPKPKRGRITDKERLDWLLHEIIRVDVLRNSPSAKKLLARIDAAIRAERKAAWRSALVRIERRRPSR